MTSAHKTDCYSLCLPKEFDWDMRIKNLILSSFFWGYTCTQIPASILAQQWIAQRLFSLTLIIAGLLTLSGPIAASYGGWQTVVATRVICGLAQGTVLPCLHTLLSKWAPPEERGRLCECTLLIKQHGASAFTLA